LLVPVLRENVLRPAVDVLMAGQSYADAIKEMVQ
jgi:hypothetical protein